MFQTTNQEKVLYCLLLFVAIELTKTWKGDVISPRKMRF
jgi:hypothetical protein